MAAEKVCMYVPPYLRLCYHSFSPWPISVSSSALLCSLSCSWPCARRTGLPETCAQLESFHFRIPPFLFQQQVHHSSLDRQSLRREVEWRNKLNISTNSWKPYICQCWLFKYCRQPKLQSIYSQIWHKRLQEIPFACCVATRRLTIASPTSSHSFCKYFDC